MVAMMSALKTAKSHSSPIATTAMEDTTTLTKDNTAQATTAASSTSNGESANNQQQILPPPLKFIEIDPNERLPLPTPPSDKALLKQAEDLVYWAISSKHENSAANQLLISSAGKNNNITSSNNNNRNTAIEAARRHALLTDLLSRKQNPTQLLYTLHAISTSNSGRELDRLVTNPKLHAQLIHLLLRMDPFNPGVDGANVIRELQTIRLAETKAKKKEQQQQQLDTCRLCLINRDFTEVGLDFKQHLALGIFLFEMSHFRISFWNIVPLLQQTCRWFGSRKHMLMPIG